MALYEPTEAEILKAAQKRAERVERGGSPDLVLRDTRSRKRHLDAIRADQKMETEKPKS